MTSIEKITANGISANAKIQAAENQKVNFTGQKVNKEKSNAAKYMLGATALAAVVLVGVLGHKNNWWKNTTKIAKDSLNKEANFAKIDSELTAKGTKIVQEKDKNITKVYHSLDNNTISDVKNYDTKTKKLLSEEYYNTQTGKLQKKVMYSYDGKTVSSVKDYDPQTGNEIRNTVFSNSDRIAHIDEIDAKTGMLKREIKYYSDGKKIYSVGEFDVKTGERIKYTTFNENNRTTENIYVLDPKTEKLVKQI